MLDRTHFSSLLFVSSEYVMRVFTKNDLLNFFPQFDTLVGIDSDGCVFNTMEVKQKEHFHPAIIRHWRLEAIEPQVRAAAEFTYLHSVFRGINRFAGLCKTFELLADWPEAWKRAAIPDPADLRTYCDSGVPMSNATIQSEAARTGSTMLFQTYDWSVALNEDIKKNMPNPPPFQDAEKALRRIRENSDAMVISQTQSEDLLRDWYRDGFSQYVSVIAGPELGSKIDHLAMASVDRYPAHAILMIGDAPGDMAASRALNCNFFPIHPGRETESWERFIDEAYTAFLSGGFTQEYQQLLIYEFKCLLPETPPWK